MNAEQTEDIGETPSLAVTSQQKNTIGDTSKDECTEGDHKECLAEPVEEKEIESSPFNTSYSTDPDHEPTSQVKTYFFKVDSFSWYH